MSTDAPIRRIHHVPIIVPVPRPEQRPALPEVDPDRIITIQPLRTPIKEPVRR